MASISPKIKKLYDAKKEAGDNVGTLEEFNSWFLAKGEEGYKNRKSVFDDFHSAGADIGANYEEFTERLGLKAVKPAVPGKTPTPQAAQAKGSTQTQPASGKRFDPNSPEARRMMAETMMMPLQGRETVANATQTMRKTSQKPFMQPNGRVQLDVMKGYTEDEQAENTLNEFEQRLNDEYNSKDFSPVSEMAMATDPFIYQSVGIMPDEEKERYDAARELISDARTTMRAAKAEKDGTFFGGAGRGLRDKLLDFDTWAMGIPELSRGGRIYVAAKKFKEGKTLTDGEKMLLEAAAVSANANGVFQKKLGRGYKAGATTAEMLPFMAEMILNPASGAGSAISKRTSNYLLKKGGSALVNSVKGKAARVGSRVVGDIAGAGAMTATTGLPAVASGALERHLGDAQYADVDGKLVYTGYEGGESWGEALAKSFGEQMIERHSEMVGEYFSPVLSFLGGTAVKLIPGKARNFIEGVVNNTANANSVKLLRKFEKEAKWNGNIGEFAEEIVGGMENALVVGDQTIDTQEGTGVFNKDNLIDTFLGVSLFGGVVSGYKTGVAGYKIHKYIKAGKELDNIDAAMSSDEKTSAKWSTIKPVLERSSIDGDVEAMGSALRDVLSDENFDTEARKKVVSYVNDLLVRKGFGIGSEAASDETTDEETDANKSFADGYAATEGTDMEDAKNAYEIQRQRAVDVLGEEYVNGIDNGGMIPTLTTDEEKKAYDDYFNAKATYDGVLQHARDEIDSRAAESHAAIDSHVNKDTGTIIPATLKDDRHVYVVNGNVAVNDDGRIDIENSDESIIIVDAETGKTDFVSPAMFLSVDEAIDPEQEKEETLNAIAESVADEFSSKIDGTLSFNIGDTYNVMDDNGSPWNVQILADNGDGTVTVAWNGNAENPQEAVPKEFIQRLSRNAALARTQEQIAQSVIDEETMPKEYGINDEITLYAEDGKPYSATIVSDESEDGLYDVQLEDGRFVQYSAQQLDEMTASPLEYEDAEAMPQQTEPAGDATEKSEGGTMPMIDGEPDYGAVTPVRTHEYLYNESGLDEETASQFVKNKANAAAKALETLNKKKPKIGTSIAEYNRQMSAWSTKAEEAEAEAAYWKSVKDEHDKVIARRMAEQHERDLAATAQAQAEEDAYRAEQEAKAAEQAALGTNNVAPSIREKWSNAPKVEGTQDEIVLPNGEKVEGRYYLVESGAASASHDSNNGFAKTEGFPVDENGGSVNDRDYERDKDAQQVTRDIAASYDSRAVQTPVVVSQDGVVLSGNGRTMAGELAAANGTDAAYNGYVASHPTRWGFTEEQVRGMQHPRVVFVPDASMPYTAETFAKFNQQEMKGQNKTEQAVKLGKVVSDGAFNRIIRIVNRFDTLGDFYADKNATAEALAELQKDGAISQAQVAEMFDGDGISAVGKELLENTLIGKAFESNADAVREITEYKSMRQSIITALAEISNNLGLGEEYSLESELAQAIDLVYKARKAGINHGEPASMFARQQNFDFYGMGETVADYTNATVMMIADILNDTRSSRLKKYMQVYNSLARDAANGQMDLFSGDVKSKEDIIDEVKQLFNYGTEEEQSKATQEAVARRKAESVQENGTVANGSEAEPAREVNTDGEASGTVAETPAVAEGVETPATEAPAAEVTEEAESGVIYTRKTLFPNSSEMHLAEHQNGVPDLLPSQGNNVSGSKVTNNSASDKNKSEKSAGRASHQKPTMTWRYYVETDDKGRVTLKREAIRNGQPPIGDERFGVQFPTYETLVEWLREGGRTDVLEQLGEDFLPASEEQNEGTKKKTRGFLNEAETAELEKLKAQMREALKKNRGNLTMGGGMFTNEGAEALTIGIKMGFLYVKSGVRQFNEFATTLIEEIGEEVRPLLKSIYNAVRDYPGAEEFEEEMTSYDEVRKANVAEIGQPQNVFDAAETIAQESEMERSAMTDEQLLESMGSNDANDSDFFTEEYDNRHSDEYNEEVDRYSAMLHENSTSKEDAEEMQAEALKLWINGAYKSAERTSVMAQIDALSDYLNAFETKEYSGNTVNTDEQGNPLNDDGTLKLEKISSIDELTDEDFSSPTRSVELPALKKNVDEAIGANGKPVIIKKNIFEKNWENHKFPFNESRSILKAALYETDLVGQTQPSTKPMHWVAIKIDEKSPIVILEVNEGKDNTEIVGWYTLDERNLERIKRQANKNGGELVILSSKDKVGSLSTPLIGLSSGSKSTNNSASYKKKSAKSEEKEGEQGDNQKKNVTLQQEQQLDLFGDLFADLNEQASETSNSNNNETTDVQSRTEEEGRGGQQPQQDAQVGRSAGHEAEGTDGRGMGGRSSLNSVSDGERSLGVSGTPQSQQHVEAATETDGKASGTVAAKNTNNNHAERGKDYAPKGVDARIEANIKAIELMQQLMLEGKQATPAQMKVLRQYSGWGGLGKAFNENPNGPYSYNPTTKRLKELLGDDAFRLAEDSRDSAFYTPAVVIDTMWDVARAMGFKGGTVLEGSAGIGNIIGAMPTDMSKRSDIHAVEIDETTGNILSLLYPDANVEVQGFEKTKIANGSVDLAITNVPFVTGLKVRDVSGDLDLSKKFKDIHDFCIAKNVRKLREGGIGIFITSNGTLDNSQKLRNWLVGEGGADVVGAFRLHNKTFGGAKVTSDIIVVRKRVNGQKSAHAIDVSTVTAERTGTFVDEKQRGKERTVSMDYNRYFMEHPENMAGEMFFGYEKGDNYRPSSKSLYPVNGKEQETMLAEWLKGFEGMKDEAQRKTAGNGGSGTEKQQDTVYESLGADVKEGSLILDKDGKLCVAQYGKAVPLSVNANKVKGHTKAECFQSYQAIKSALADVLAYQTENEGDEGLKPLLDKLNKAYDGFVKTYGHLHKNTSISFLKNDVDFPNILALEKHSEEGDKKGNKVDKFEKTDIFKQRVVEKDKAPEPKNVKDGIIASIYQYGRIDVPYIAEKVGKSVDDVKQEIVSSGLGFENPNTLQMEVSYEYLSGNVREKLKQAEEANEGGKYAANIEALRKVIPMDIPVHLIDFTLGSSWVEPKLYEDFIKERTDVDAQLTNVGGTWYVSLPYYVNNEKNKAMGVKSQMFNTTILGTQLIEAALQNRTITVSKTEKHYDGSTETITDREATQACSAKIDEIRADFKEWARQKMQSDAEMSARIEKAYNEQFNNYVPVDVSMDFVPEYFVGANHKFKMREHQAKAIVRGTMQPLLLAHEVGTGKTFTLISTAMEMRRLGTAKKPMIVVQNATVGQFVASAKELYPNAKVLTLEDKDHTGEGRKNFYAKIKYNDWDMIVVPQSVFERIPDSEERQMRFIQDKIDEKIAILEQMREADQSGRSTIVRQAEKEIEQLNDQLGAIGETATTKRKQRDSKREHITRQNTEVKASEMLDRETDDVENFDDMGIDAILVDEAHEYKHLGFATAMQRGVKGIDPSYSKKSQGVYLKTQAVLEKNNGRNVIFATGTPISNTAAEIWTFMRYLMPSDTMKDYGIYYFDDFVRNFGNLTQMLEFTTNGKFKENNRFAGYVNLPELVRIWSSIADTVRTDEAQAVKDNVPDIEGGQAQDIYLPQTRALRSIMKFVKAELERFENMSGKEKKENSHIPLTMYGVAKAAAVDARLVMEDAEDDTNSKTNEAVRQTLKSLKETAKYKGTVALFADNYQNKHSGFNLYDDIREKLIAQGVPANEVVVIRSGMTIKKKQEIFDKVNRGEIRVILGSTFTLGTGVNIQERLHTLIHLDAPNRPMDYTQRNGRIVRQGNLHKVMGIPVRVLRFGVQDSLDVTAYQRLKTKGAIADSIMKGKAMMQNSMEDRAMEEDEDVFGDTVAQLSGSQYAMLKNQAEREVRKYESKRKQWEADQAYVHNAIPRITAQIAEYERKAAENNANLAKIEEAFGGSDKPAIKVGKHTFADIAGMADFFTEQNKKVKETEDEIRKSTGEEQRTRTVDVQIGNATFTIKTTQKKELSYHGGTVDTKVSRSITISCPELGIEDMKGGAYFKNAMENIFNDVVSGSAFREDAAYYSTRAERLKGELELVKSREGQPFQYDKELEDARQKYDEYTDLMKKEMEEKEKKYAEMDSDVEAATGITDAEEDDEEGDAEMQISETEPFIDNTSSEAILATETIIDALKANAGIDVVMETQDAGQRVVEKSDAEMSKRKKRALETASVISEETHQPTVVSSADGAKVLKNLDTLKQDFEKLSNSPKFFIGTLAEKLGATNFGSKSKYASFETANGKIVTIRLSNHNASTSTFDNNDEDEGISIVISPKSNEGINNDGNAHIVEFFYNSIRLRRAEGKPLVSIINSIQQALYSGEYTDTTGIAEREEVNGIADLMERTDGTVYGWSEGNRIHLTPEGINPNTPIHEYTHLWAKAVQQNAPELWNNIKDLLRGTPVWEEVVADKAYSNLDSEDQIASEALARMSGRDNAKRMTEKAREIIDAAKKEGIFAEAEARTLIQRMRDALMKFWKWVGTNLFDIERFDNVSEVTDRVLYDLVNKTDLELDAGPGNNGGAPDFQIVTDKDTIAQLEASPKITGYRNVALRPDGTLGSPMASSLRSSGKGKVKTGSFELGKWEQAEEHPEIAKEVKRADGSTAYKVDLVKPDEKTVGSVDYNPYIHNRPNMVNKQFKQAWERPELVYIETEIPTDDLSSGYHAEKAAKSVGVHAWPTPSSSQRLILSRYDKPMRIVPWEEVADDWEAEFGERGVEFDIIPPALLPILSERGVKILPPHKGMGEACEKAYREFSEKLRQERLSAGTSRDVLMRDAADYYSGEVLPIEERGGEYRVAGLNADYPGKESLIDAFKDKYPEYIVTVSEDGNSIEVSPWEVALKDSERTNSTNRARAAYVERKTRRAMSLIEDTAKKLGLNVEVLTTTEGLTGRRARSKGWYDPFSGKITVVLPNHVNGGDVMRTLLHEGVAHHGLRQMFGDDFSVFLDNVYANLEYGARKRIVGIAAMNGWDIHVATEEYLAGLAEDTDFERAVNQRWWTKIRNLFIDLLRKAGINIGYISDDDLRYILWRSYQHLKEDAITTSAEDVLMQQKLGVGRFAKVADSGADGLLYRDGTPMDERDKKIVRDRYERTIRSSAFQFREAMQDSMLSVRRLMESIADKDIEDIAGFENTYLAENRLSSTNKSEADLYKKLLLTPLIDELRRLSGNRGNRDEVTDYMMAKHGLERNEVMARKDAEKQAREKYSDDIRSAQKAADDDPLDWEAQDRLEELKKEMQDFTDALYEKNREKDYGGITGQMEEENLVAAEAMARELVEKFESEHDTERLWALTNACTKASLDKMYKSGILSKSAYEDIRDMYEYYIPLRGFDETTTEDVYAYLTSERSGFSSVMKKAEGRKSKADDPIATIATMAENAIMQGNRNLMKQTFLKFAMNHPSDAVSVNKMWIRYDETTNEWYAVTADIKDNDSPEEVLRKTEEFEERMEGLSKSEPDKYKRAKDAVGIPYKVLDKNINEHQIHVKLVGQDYIITINGSPRAAQAVNGLTNPDADISGSIGAIMKAGEFVNRNLSALYTTRNPEFVLSNFLRDALYANSTMWVKESPRYAWKFNRNFASIRPDVVYRLIQKHNSGTLDMGNELERAFYQFMMNGGETGYTSVQDIEKKKKIINKYVRMKDATIPVELAWNLLGEKLDDINRAVENCARFSAFLTSRQMGRTIERSVWDAKEVSVNFNKKGAGSTFMGKEGQTFIGNAGAFTSGLGRSFYVFWNAAVQGTTNFGRLHKRHTVKALTMDATLMLLGAVISGLGGGDDDDYWNLPTYVRRNNICFKIPGTNAFCSIPLGIEQRAIYGLGELFSSLASGRERMTGEEIAMEIAGTMSSLLPLDLMESNGNIGYSSVVPSWAKPFVEAESNKDWKGLPIYNDSPWKDGYPEWTKAGKRTNENLVAFTKWLNEVGGGNDVKSGGHLFNWNPSKIEHVIEGFGGGITTTINKLVKMGKTLAGTQEFDWTNMLMASRVVKSADEKAEARRVSKEFWKYKDEHDDTGRVVKLYEGQSDDGVEGAEEKLNAFYDSPEYGRYEIIDEYYPDIKVIGDELKETVDEAEKDVLQAERDSLMRAAVEEVRAFDDSRK